MRRVCTRWFALIGLLMGMMAAVQPATAVTVTDLYETAIPVQTTRDEAFVEALRQVAVRVSGRRDAPAQLGAVTSNPRQFVQRFGVTAEGILEVGFDSASIDRALSSAGLPIWGRERPATLVLLHIEESGGTSYWLDPAAPPTERELITKTARARGMPIVWAAMDAQDRAEAEAGGEALAGLIAKYGSNAALIGRARRDATGGYSVRWTLVNGDQNSETMGGLEDGIHFAADSFARVYATSGTTLGNVTVEVSGITDLSAYATTLNYLEAMTLVRAVALEQVAGETLRFRLAVRGDAVTLRRAIALDSKLVPVAKVEGEVASADRLHFRYQH